ncbi:ComF family protein [Marinobacterium lacunae]|uniref:ComF family protein n=1 Tax=Marinobacterium lacunae TaxID=1232683 RepID=UPI0012DC27FE|nr:ComF family protein [Marinobacterium lacunae]
MKNLKSYYRLFFDQSCHLCQIYKADTHGLCEACHSDLPWLISACHQCGEPIPPRSDDIQLCRHCQQSPPAFDRTHAAFAYTFPINQLIPAIKYNRRPEALGWLSLVFAQMLEDRIDSPPELLLPVPLHPWRALKRGFNQAGLIAGELGRHLRLPVHQGLIRKRRATASQAGLDRSTRSANLFGSFRLTGTIPAHVALIDDVMTTGSTAQELARLLKGAGAQRVEVWVLARTPTKG